MILGADEIRSRLEKDALWKDEEDNNLLHHTARLGDDSLVESCLAAGVPALAFNSSNESPRDMARIWGYDRVAEKINAQMKKEKAEKIPYASLKEIREKSFENGINLFHQIAQQSKFDQVVALALKNAETLLAEDLLSKGADGETVLLKLCQQEQLPFLLKPELWVKNPDDFSSVWEKVPKIYQKNLDAGNILSRARQINIQSRPAFRPNWKK